MLRQHPDLGISTPHGDTLTSIFFADDSTLLSKDLPSAVEQLAVVEEFCVVSWGSAELSQMPNPGPEWSPRPCRHRRWGILNIVPTGQPIKYLGVMFGHELLVDYQLNLVHERFMACFQQWGCRARTLQGRRLLADTVMLSLLWHVTAATPVPPKMVQSWQAMINRYILGRKTLSTDRYRPLIPQPLQFDPQLGLGLPHVASRLRAQRSLMLQRAMAPTANDPPYGSRSF
ncbi:Aste57867_6611 [Aphanomyces stellatus]|uniref:Aste57867_6611 protein n=1 Tax=Aphanomyces stellatus TaxID=120398 RepID=A0A485KFY2_9STRA|nr:hypothetical protein As57867_006593 [Aphanomyces stellatus]VFT83589.1 Aste57867_6611 [Aphanomyces stellatus]